MVLLYSFLWYDSHSGKMTVGTVRQSLPQKDYVLSALLGLVHPPFESVLV